MDASESLQIKTEEHEKMLIDPALSGGCFQPYLQEMLNAHGPKLQLLLAPVRKLFALPCRDGQGSDISADELDAFLGSCRPVFSDALCVNYIFLSEIPAVVLYDDADSLQRKKKIALSFGIPCLENIK